MVLMKSAMVYIVNFKTTQTDDVLRQMLRTVSTKKQEAAVKIAVNFILKTANNGALYMSKLRPA